MKKRGEGKPGRGCCARCFTPTMCARPVTGFDPCGCHVPRGEACRATGCGAGLYVVIPGEERPADELAAQLALATKYGYTRKTA